MYMAMIDNGPDGGLATGLSRAIGAQAGAPGLQPEQRHASFHPMLMLDDVGHLF
jgi:hypothetical protein